MLYQSFLLIHGLSTLDLKRWKKQQIVVFSKFIFILLPASTLKQMVAIQMKMGYKVIFIKLTFKFCFIIHTTNN